MPGERFSWSGSLKTYPLASHGQFEVGNLQARTIWNYLRDTVQFELPSGAISIAGDYDFTAATSPVGLGVNVHDVTITDLAVRPKGATGRLHQAHPGRSPRNARRRCETDGRCGECAARRWRGTGLGARRWGAQRLT